MTKAEAVAHLQQMHQTKKVTRDTIIAWYCFFEDKLPRCRPESSRAELLKTLQLWQDLTHRGGAPGLPSDYTIEV